MVIELMYNLVVGLKLDPSCIPWQHQGLHVRSIEFELRFANIARELIDIAGLSDTAKVIAGASDKVLRGLKAEHGLVKSICCS